MSVKYLHSDESFSSEIKNLAFGFCWIIVKVNVLRVELKFIARAKCE